MIQHPQIEISRTGSNIPIFYLNSEHLDEDIKFINDNNINDVSINPHKGYKLKNADVFIALPNVKRISLAARDLDLSVISKLTQVEFLFIGEDNYNIDLSNCKKLESLNFKYDNSIKGLGNLKELREITVSKGDCNFFNRNIFSNYSKLEKLEIIQSKLPSEMSFFECLLNLKELDILYSKGEIDLIFLKYIQRSLENLKIKNSKKVSHIEAIYEMPNLKWLSLVDSIPLENSKLINKLTHLEVLIVLGTSFFIDGDISNLTKLNLKHVSIDDKRHYNLKYADMPQLPKKEK
jgi:hypothetical protein